MKTMKIVSGLVMGVVVASAGSIQAGSNGGVPPMPASPRSVVLTAQRAAEVARDAAVLAQTRAEAARDAARASARAAAPLTAYLASKAPVRIAPHVTDRNLLIVGLVAAGWYFDTHKKVWNTVTGVLSSAYNAVVGSSKPAASAPKGAVVAGAAKTGTCPQDKPADKPADVKA